jgi:hypothetical protein
MKSSFCSSSSVCLKSMLLIVQLAFFGSPILVKAGQRDSSTGPIQAELNDQAEVRQGYLLVYSATDRFDDGGTFYYPHSSYSIYTADGKFFKNVENHISRSDKIPRLRHCRPDLISFYFDRRTEATFACPLSSPQGDE